MSKGRRYRTLKQLSRNRLGLFGLVVVLLFVFVAVLAPVLAPHDPYETNLAHRLEAPNIHFRLGTDKIGRDLESRLIYGARVSLTFGIVTTAVAFVLGLGLGLVAGYVGGVLDNILMRAMDLILIFPDILLAIAVVSALGPGLANAMVAISIGSVPLFARIVRAQTLTVKEKLYVSASQALGARSWRVVIKHILPNTVAALIVLGTLRIGTAILAASTLSFLGLGVQAPVPEWGAILADGRSTLRSGPHLMFFPGIALSLVVIGFASVGDALRDALDPRMQVRS